ncbi:hypothetical protein GQX74_010072 [Glossina fuscipes]|nr:hypothetical protein GQX74_010072 [Glossina fuscipes]
MTAHRYGEPLFITLSLKNAIIQEGIMKSWCGSGICDHSVPTAIATCYCCCDVGCCRRRSSDSGSTDGNGRNVTVVAGRLFIGIKKFLGLVNLPRQTEPQYTAIKFLPKIEEQASVERKRQRIEARILIIFLLKISNPNIKLM